MMTKREQKMERLNRQMAADFLAVPRHEIRCAYSGRPGCACGCNGTYYYTKAHQAEQSTRRGYTVEDAEVRDDQVTRIWRKVYLELAIALDARDLSSFLVSESFISWTASPRRVYTVYYTGE